MTNAAKKVIDDLGRVRAFAQTMLDCNTDSPNVHEMVRDTADNAIAFMKSQERYIEDLEQGVPVTALETLSERLKELEAMQKAHEPKPYQFFGTQETIIGMNEETGELNTFDVYKCPNCEMTVTYAMAKGWHWCPECGQAVKWDG